MEAHRPPFHPSHSCPYSPRERPLPNKNTSPSSSSFAQHHLHRDMRSIGRPFHIERHRQFAAEEQFLQMYEDFAEEIVNPFQVNPLTKSELQKVRKVSFSDLSEEVEEADCSICFGSLDSEHEISALKCSHKFHSSCLEPWVLQEKPRCPMCRVNIRSQL